MHFEFEYPAFFLLLLPIACIFLCPIKPQKRYFVHLHLFDVSKNFIDKEKLLVASILASMVVALASPVVYEQKVPQKRKGRELVLVLDSSGSMNESGFDKKASQKSKYDVLVQILKDFIQKRGDDNIGVVVFGTFAFTASALTYDMHALSYMLEYLEAGLAGENTAIGDGLHQANALLEKSKAKEKVIVLVSDGYQNSGSFSIQEEVSKAKQAGVKIYTIGIGDKGDFDKKLLEKIAHESGGVFFQAKDAKELTQVYEKLDKLEPSPIRSERYLNKTSLCDLWMMFALGGLFVLLYQRQKKVMAV
jgi:Ca-activated chloride channel family protein